MNNHINREIKAAGQSPAFGQGDGPDYSVLLPTFNRLDALERTLMGLEGQTVANETYEVVVVDDGSSDTTESFLQQFSERTPNQFAYTVLKENGGPARARNTGLQLCRGRIILIVGDDVEPDPTLLEKHAGFHEQNPGEEFALLGHVGFPEEMNPNAFMRWLEEGGRKYFFNYADLTPGQTASPLFFYTCNISVKASLLLKSGDFDESFRYASHEDLELGYRLADAGMQLVYDDTASGAHWHMLSVQGIARRVYLMGYSAVLFWQKADDRGGWLRRTLRRSLAWVSTTPPLVYFWNRLRHMNYEDEKLYPVRWHILLGLGFFIGLSDSLNNRTPRT